MKLGIAPRRSSSVCILTAAVVARKDAHGKTDKHRSIVVESVLHETRTLRWREMDSNHRSRRERDGRGGGPRPTIVVSRDDLCLMTPVQLIGPAGNSRETLFAKSGTDGSKPVPSSSESSANRTSLCSSGDNFAARESSALRSAIRTTSSPAKIRAGAVPGPERGGLPLRNST